MRAIHGWLAAAGLAAALAAAAGCRGPDEPEARIAAKATAVLEAKSGSNLRGRATFSMNGETWVVFRVEVEGLTSGLHAVHIHEKGDCTAADGASAAGHWNPTNRKHGKWGEGEFHLGDIGNIEVGADGKGVLEMTTDLWQIGTGSPNDVVGKSVIVHGGTDDFTSQPAGNAGNRIGCGVIVPGR